MGRGLRTRRGGARVPWRPIVVLVVGAFAVHALLPLVGEARATASALRGADPGWLGAGLLAALVSYPAAGIAQLGATPRPLPLPRTTAVQLAAAFTNQLAPAGLGGLGVNLAYLQRAGMDRPAAVASLTAKLAAAAVLHAVELGVAVLLVGRRAVAEVRLPPRWPLLAAVVLALAAAGAGLALRTRARALLPSVRRVTGELAARLRRPGPAAQLLGGSIGVTASYLLCLLACLHAVGVQLPFVAVAAAYLGGTALASAAPTPGGIGAVESALAAGLTALGAALAPAVAGVLAFRVLTFWLPILPGSAAYALLRRRRVL